MTIYKEWIPSGESFIKLVDSTGWNGITDKGPERLGEALRNSWFVVSAFEEDELIAVGRVISDGVFQALICDLIVLPDHQGRGIGSEILRQLLMKCHENDILMVQLFAAKDKHLYYKQFGFEARPSDAPGMRWMNRDIF